MRLALAVFIGISLLSAASFAAPVGKYHFYWCEAGLSEEENTDPFEMVADLYHTKTKGQHRFRIVAEGGYSLKKIRKAEITGYIEWDKEGKTAVATVDKTGCTMQFTYKYEEWDGKPSTNAIEVVDSKKCAAALKQSVSGFYAKE